MKNTDLSHGLPTLDKALGKIGITTAAARSLNAFYAFFDTANSVELGFDHADALYPVVHQAYHLSNVIPTDREFLVQAEPHMKVATAGLLGRVDADRFRGAVAALAALDEKA